VQVIFQSFKPLGILGCLG